MKIRDRMWMVWYDGCFVLARRRGFGMLGLAGLITILAIMCAAVSISSMRSARGSIRGIQRLQIQAAAEGAAVMIASSDAPTSGTVRIGDCRIDISTETVDSAGETSGSARQLKVDLMAGNRVAFSRNYRAISTGTSGSVALEVMP